MSEVKLKKGTEAFANRQAILKEEFFELKRYYDGLRKIRGPNVDNFDYSKFYIVSNKKINDETLLVENQKVFEPEKLKDTNPPIITVSKKSDFIFEICFSFIYLLKYTWIKVLTYLRIYILNISSKIIYYI